MSRSQIALGRRKSWLQGDYNYDGKTDLTDFTFLASNFNQTVPASGVGAIVPEPMSHLLPAAAALWIRRRRRGGVAELR